MQRVIGFLDLKNTPPMPMTRCIVGDPIVFRSRRAIAETTNDRKRMAGSRMGRGQPRPRVLRGRTVPAPLAHLCLPGLLRHTPSHHNFAQLLAFDQDIAAKIEKGSLATAPRSQELCRRKVTENSVPIVSDYSRWISLLTWIMMDAGI